MRNPYGKEICDEIRQNVRDDLHRMLVQITNKEMQGWVVEAWATSLYLNGFSAIRELQGSGNIDNLVEKGATQADHLCGVADFAKSIGETLLRKNPDLDIDIDTLIAGGLLHDLGKPIEYNIESRRKWLKEPHKEGNPTATHAMYGYYICMLLELPTAICHIPANHCMEASAVGVVRSIACTIVNHADYLYWDCLRIMGLLDPEYPYSRPRWEPYQYRTDPTKNYFKQIIDGM